MKPKHGNPGLSHISASCHAALQAIERSPLDLDSGSLKHISQCPMCSEARVMFLAQDDFDPCLAPAGYFDKLPSRVLQKLPVAPVRFRLRTMLLISAASMFFLTGLGGYWYGRQSHLSTIVLEAVIPIPKDLQDPFFQDYTSFTSIELFSQVESMTPEETQKLMEGLKKQEANLQPATALEGN
ncbi:MAG: hypothetical protein FWG12_05470 [Holophagaceae bacterium]|nr:hypothetical protein [Holophagaceae bacterium]